MTEQHAQNRAGIVAIVVGMTLITVNDTLVKGLSGGYPLHQIIMARALIGALILAVVVALMGGVRLLRIRQPVLHAVRALLIVLERLLLCCSCRLVLKMNLLVWLI